MNVKGTGKWSLIGYWYEEFGRMVVRPLSFSNISSTDPTSGFVR